ncbi:hypothetical protein OE494_30370 [Pseudomonas aeruginosa]|uniref:hypothetical protein n=1 Tax=Pseudomonas aeruginosa TaxID=287 RepID=UPI001C1DF45E|nr:hypothetical protein [Pseudomonas aeruginosa]EIU2642509.1 hypothetical protein [Pseudomonas aeruginosa]EIU9550996.1 hypothetical protein [Pseudomonas aeruginosa]EIY2511830.1 hypothetical protein [Pseudomonas aeruginosa]EIY2820210.1 hypothetical protein [Pseudomonas aeruginosa]EJS3802151.1 hypothetical protein [Pseudomonas aeruginosa]
MTYPLNNTRHNTLFSLPPIAISASTAPAAQELPPQQVVTGDKEVDAVLWLREVIATGQPGPIATALEAAKKIKTPLTEIAKRYGQHLAYETGSPFAAALGSFGFDDLDGLAKGSIEREKLRAEARGRFPGDSIWQNTPAEEFCLVALNRCKGFRDYLDYDREAVSKRFRKHADMMPATLADCTLELDYWRRLDKLRHASGNWGDGLHKAIARQWFVEELLAEIPPRSYEEARQVLDWVNDNLDDPDFEVFRNLLRHPGLERHEATPRWGVAHYEKEIGNGKLD